MTRRLLAYPATKPSGRAADIERVRAQLLDVDAERWKRIDTVIDYFGGGPIRAARDGPGDASSHENGVQ